MSNSAYYYLDTSRQFNTAVLFLVFNRPDTTQQVFETIRQVRASRLYIAADGPRNDHKSDIILCKKTRQIVSAVDWNCKVQTLFREKNLGCKLAVSSAIDWFFEHEEQGIILEDDCLPSQSFFWYCQELLDRYKDDERIMVISGNNFQREKVTQRSYYFSRYNHCWGWATWRRAWKHYDREMKHWPEFKKAKGLESFSGRNKLFVYYWQNIFEAVASNKIDSWAYIWTFSCWAQSGLTCLPTVNLVQNIGFGQDATHTKETNSPHSHSGNEITFPLQHPDLIFRNSQADHFTDTHHFRITRYNLIKSKIIYSIKSLLSR